MRSVSRSTRQPSVRDLLYRHSSLIRRAVNSTAYRRLRGHRISHIGELDIEELRRLIGKKDPVIIEVGANDGHHTRLFLQTFKRAIVHAFEPDERALSKLRANVYSRRANLYPIAISNTDGKTSFFASGGHPKNWTDDPAGWDGSGSIRRPTGHLEHHPEIIFEEESTVDTMRLDSWASVAQIDVVDFMWADVQGAERELILGGLETLSRTRFFYTEYSDEELYEDQIDLAGILQLLPDFTIERKYPSDVLLKNTKL